MVLSAVRLDFVVAQGIRELGKVMYQAVRRLDQRMRDIQDFLLWQDRLVGTIFVAVLGQGRFILGLLMAVVRDSLEARVFVGRVMEFPLAVDRNIVRQRANKYRGQDRVMEQTLAVAELGDIKGQCAVVLLGQISDLLQVVAIKYLMLRPLKAFLAGGVHVEGFLRLVVSRVW